MNLTYVDNYIAQSAKILSDKSPSEGRQDLAVLIQVATATSDLAKLTGDKLVELTAENAWSVADATFGKYRKGVNVLHTHDPWTVADLILKELSIYKFCEGNVRDYRSLEQVEKAAIEEYEVKKEFMDVLLEGAHELIVFLDKPDN